MRRQRVRLWYILGIILVFMVSALSAQTKDEKEKGIKLPEKVIRGQVAPQDIKQKMGLQKEVPLFEEEKGLSPLPSFNKDEKAPKTRTNGTATHGRVAHSLKDLDSAKKAGRSYLANATVYGGNYGEFFAGALYGQQFKKFDILFDSNYHQENGWRKHMGYHETNGKLNAGLYLDGHRLEISAQLYNRLMELPGAVDFEKIDSSRYTDNGNGELTYTMRLTDLQSLKMKAFADRTQLYDRHREEYTHQKSGGGFEFNVMLKHPLTFGIEGYSDILEGEYRPNIGSIYVYDNSIPLGKQFNLSVGIEAQEHTDFYGQINPHVALWGGIADRTRIKASIDRKMKPFDFNEHYLKNNFAQIEEDQLSPEREWSYQAEVSYQLLENLELKLKLQEREVIDYIAWDQDWASAQRDYTDIDEDSDSEDYLKRNTDTLWAPVNIEHAIFRGGTGGLVWEIYKGWQYKANVGYIQANNMKEDKVIPYFPEFRANESVHYEGFLNAFIEAKYFGRYYYDKDVYDRVLSDYTLVNARVDKELWERITFFVDGRNLLSTQYEIVKGYPSEPIQVDGGITVRF